MVVFSRLQQQSLSGPPDEVHLASIRKLKEYIQACLDLLFEAVADTKPLNPALIPTRGDIESTHS